ncbi:hypothetical protein [Thalassolituus sp.]|uniref:hypothetical protein n=1 Tax=Thalassolituus sp. TaxID=2030822 RepID=UPI003515BCE9
MHSSALEWRLKPSLRQRRLHRATLLLIGLTLLLAVPLLAFLYLLLVCVWWQVSRRILAPAVDALGVNQNGWWIECAAERHPVTWLNGSHRRAGHLRLVWGFWPWQAISIFPDSLRTADDFRRLKASLYGAV